MKKYILIVALCLSQHFYAGDFFQFKLEKNEKLEGTFSGELNTGRTIHLVLIKNADSRKYEIIPFLADNSNTIKKLDTFISDKKLDILSYHSKNETLLIVCYDKENESLVCVDYNLVSGKSKSMKETLKKAPENVFRLENKTILVTFDSKIPALKTKIITDLNNITNNQFEVKPDKVKNFKSLISENPEVINQQEYVMNGSISKRKAYFLNNHLIYTFEKEKDKMLFFDFDLQNEKSLKNEILNLDFTEKTKDLSNYFYDNKLLFLSVKKDDIEINGIDLLTMKALKKLSGINSLASNFTPDDFKAFIKEASKSYNKSTITINKTKDSNLAFRLDNVEEATYQYNSFWFIHFMMWNQQMMMQQNFRASMGPAQMDELALLFTKKEKQKPLEFILDSSFNVFNGESVTAYTKIDKVVILEKYKEDKSKKEFTASFTDSEVRYIYQDKKTKTINIAFDKF